MNSTAFVGSMTGGGYYKGLKRTDARRQYYKRVRTDAPSASELLKTINDLVDRIRKTREPASVFDFSYGKQVIEKRKANLPTGICRYEE